MNTLSIQKDVPLAPLTTLGVGGAAEFFVRAHTESELSEAVAWANNNGHPLTIIGSGSNVLVADEGVRGLVIHIDIDDVTFMEDGDVVLVRAGAGVIWDDLVASVVKKGLWGFENLSAIPGTVGATPVQNVGAYGVEVGDYIRAVRVYDMKEEVFKVLPGAACMFTYRDSLFKHAEGKHFIVTQVTYVLSPIPQPHTTYKDLNVVFGERTEQPSLQEIRDAVTAIRANKFPDTDEIGTAGSFFHNPIVSQEQYEKIRATYPEFPAHTTDDGRMKLVLAWFLDTVLHLRGVQEGRVGMYEKHALVLVNHGQATAYDIETFAHTIEKKVFDTLGVRIEREVKTKK